jgi:hypothetical protein
MLRDQIDYQEFCRRGQKQSGEACAGMPETVMVNDRRPIDYRGNGWARPPMVLDRIAQAIGALFPAVICIVGGLIATRRKVASRTWATS